MHQARHDPWETGHAPPWLFHAIGDAVAAPRIAAGPAPTTAAQPGCDAAPHAERRTTHPGAERLVLAPYRLRRVRAHVAAHLPGKISLSSMAAAAGLSASHFCRRFHGATGLTPLAYVRRHRIGLAVRMMLGSARPIAEISLAAGFASQSHFTNAFTHAVGMPPARWRAEAQAMALAAAGDAAAER
jgi:AraC-like DNA-binding protein